MRKDLKITRLFEYLFKLFMIGYFISLILFMYFKCELTQNLVIVSFSGVIANLIVGSLYERFEYEA